MCTWITHSISHRYLRDASHHSVIYRHSDLDLSTVAGATCGSSNEAIRRELLQLQDLVIRSAESARLQKRQTRFDSTLVRCWLYAIADYKFVAALEAAGDNPLGVMSTIILTVRGVWWVRVCVWGRAVPIIQKNFLIRISQFFFLLFPDNYPLFSFKSQHEHEP